MRRIRLQVDDDTLRRLNELADAKGRLWYREAELLLSRAVAAEERRRATRIERRLGRVAQAVSAEAEQ